MTSSRPPKERPCVWRYYDYADYWDTGCRKVFAVTEGTPTENGMRFCCFCGKSLKEGKVK